MPNDNSQKASGIVATLCVHIGRGDTSILQSGVQRNPLSAMRIADPGQSQPGETDPLPGFVPGAVDVTGLKGCANGRSEDQTGVLPTLTSAQLLGDLARAVLAQVFQDHVGRRDRACGSSSLAGPRWSLRRYEVHRPWNNATLGVIERRRRG